MGPERGKRSLSGLPTRVIVDQRDHLLCFKDLPVNLLGSTGQEDLFRGVHHRVVRCADQLIRVDADVDPSCLKLVLRDAVIARGDADDGHVRRLRTPPLHEGEDLVWGLLLGVDHDAVGAALLHVRPGALQGLLLAEAGDECFDPGEDHEVLGHLRLFPHLQLLAEGAYVLQLLRPLGTEKRILLEAGLVLDDHPGHAQPLETLHRPAEDLLLPAGVTVIEDRLG
mmetsp:Transcript_63418/g.166121  ORF Transcript_63418/g.166121 Transcript_63418/m.166121 type:complete len:225 (-) Transcript_63418:452-1126(-)